MTRGGKPNVTRTVIEDEGGRVEELRIRGRCAASSSPPKGPMANTCEISTGRPFAREASAFADPRCGSIGQRSWRIFSF